MNLSAEKRVRQNKKRRLHNRMVKSEVRTAVKSFESAVNANSLLDEVIKTSHKLDQFIQKN